MKNSYHVTRFSAAAVLGWLKVIWIKAGEFDKIQKMTEEAVALVKEIRSK